MSIAAQSASKLYDGTALTRGNGALVYGLPTGLNITVSCGGSQTNVGSSANTVTGYSIYNKSGENVTAHFKNVRTVTGTLAVSKA